MLKITIVGMIYKSVEYLKFMMKGLERSCVESQHDVDYLVVANDASQNILDYISENSIKHIIYNDPQPNDFYLNRVYRAWNFGGVSADGDIIVFVNSDMAFSSGWLDRLIDKLDRDTIPCSRLVESGKMPSAETAVSHNLGQTVSQFREGEFLKFASEISENTALARGLFMPCAFYKDDFIRSGGYPEGNIYKGGVGKHKTRFKQSGDNFFFYNNPVMGRKKHITICDSIVYHIQEGELDE